MDDRPSASRLSSEQPQYTLVLLPMELLVYIISFASSTRDRVKLRYVSQRLRAAMDTPSLWRDFTWSHFDFREKRSIESILKSRGENVKRLTFSDHVIPVKLLQHCCNLVQLSLPSAKLNLNQLRKAVKSLRKLQYLDVLWSSKNDIKRLLSIGVNLKEITIRIQVTDSSFHNAVYLLLSEWARLRSIPHTLNLVTTDFTYVFDVLEQWMPSNPVLFASHTGHFKLYTNFKTLIGLIPTLPRFQLQFGSPGSTVPFLNASMYGLLGLDKDSLLLSDRIINNDCTLSKAMLTRGRVNDLRGPLNTGIMNLEFLTHFCAVSCYTFLSGHLEQLAFACPNLLELNLMGNVDCLKRLQGLRAIATNCQRLEGLNVLFISSKDVENCVQLWEILVDMQLIYLAIESCCLQCSEGNDQTIQILHQKCLKMKSLESYYCYACPKCLENKRPFSLSKFPSLIHCITKNIDIVDICEKLRYLQYSGNDISCSWSLAHCNLEQLCISSDQLVLPDSFMNTISTHGGLVHVILSVHFVTQNGIATLIENSPHLITCRVHIRTGEVWRLLFNPRDFKSRLEKKYSHRKLYLCGSFYLLKGKLNSDEVSDLVIKHNMDFTTMWDLLFGAEI